MFSSKRKTEVQVAGKSLVATFSNANPPLIWKFDLVKNHSFTLALQGEEGDDWELGVTSPTGEFTPVARFLSREDADEAFFKMHDALTVSQKPWYKRLFRLILIIAAAVIAFVILLNMLRSFAIHSAMESVTGPVTAPMAVQTAPVPVQEGVPQSADEVLQPPH